MKNKPKHRLALLASTASEDELRQLQQAIDGLKPLLDQHRAAVAEVEAYRIATDAGSKTLAEITAYVGLNPLSPIAQALVSMEVNNSSIFRKSKPKGSQSKSSKFIHKLAIDHPDKSVKELLQLKGVSDAIGTMSYGRFANVVSEARQPKK
jgi:hypothetical protein